MIFTTTSDAFVRKRTAGTFIIFTVAPLMGLLFGSDQWLWPLVFFMLFMLILLYTYVKKPTHYKLDNERLLIHRPIGNIAIRLQDIARVDSIQQDLLWDASKGGAFGYIGNFDTALGTLKFYATRRDRLVMLTKRDASKIILTPDQPTEFIRSIEMTTISQTSLSQNAC